MSKQVILTGIRANNDLHLGNYLGALLPMVDMAKKHGGEHQVNLFVPDLHSFTTPIDHSTFNGDIMNNLRVFVAAGLPLDNPDVHIYRQSYIPAHSELTWILDCFTDIGEMNRMIQFTEKSGRMSAKEVAFSAINALRAEMGDSYWSDSEIEAKINNRINELNERGKKSVSVGLLNYPVLMAADILLYGSSYIPVGEDQTQHLEFTRDIAERMNKQFGELFVVPKPVKEQHALFGKDQGLRIKDLLDPTKKMSKSDETGKGVIFLSDTPDEAYVKIMSATTDNLNSVKPDPVNQPGVTNLLTLLKMLNEYSGNYNMPDPTKIDGYKQLKTVVAEVVSNFLTDFQDKLAGVDDKAILAKLETSEKEMTVQANATLLKVQKAVGLRA